MKRQPKRLSDQELFEEHIERVNVDFNLDWCGLPIAVEQRHVDDLRRAEASVRRLRRQAEHRLANKITTTRVCEQCSEALLIGRADLRYCSSACRQAAHRSRIKA